MQEKKALTSRGWGLLRGFLELRRPWGFFILSAYYPVLDTTTAPWNLSSIKADITSVLPTNVSPMLTRKLRINASVP